MKYKKYVYDGKKQITEKDFLRKFLINFGLSDQDYTDDISKMSIKEVKRCFKDVYIFKANVERRCTLGIKCKNEYGDKQTEKFESKLTYQFSDLYLFNVENSNGSSDHENNEKLKKALINIDNDKLVENSVEDLPEELILRMKNLASSIAEYKIKLPRKIKKEKEFETIANIIEVECVQLPYIEIEFTFDGASYNVGGFDCFDEIVFIGKTPERIYISEVLSKKIKPLKIISTCLFIPSFLSFIFLYWTPFFDLSVIFHNFLSVYSIVFLLILFIFLFSSIGIFYVMKYKNKLFFSIGKINSIKKQFELNSLEEITSSDINEIDFGIDQQFLNITNSSKKNKIVIKKLLLKDKTFLITTLLNIVQLVSIIVIFVLFFISPVGANGELGGLRTNGYSLLVDIFYYPLLIITSVQSGAWLVIGNKRHLFDYNYYYDFLLFSTQFLLMSFYFNFL